MRLTSITLCRITLWFAVLAVVMARPAVAADDPDTCALPPALVIEHATLLTMARGAPPVDDATVLVRGQRISWIGPAAAAAIPPDAQRIDGRGRWLMPGLVDAHVHVENPRWLRLLLRDPSIPDSAVTVADAYLPYVAYGILQIGNLGAMSEAIGERRAIESGEVLGPHTMLAAMVDGDPSSLVRRTEVATVHPLLRRFWLDQNPYFDRNGPERVALLRGIIAFNDKVVRAFVAASLPVLAGTDSSVPGVVPGEALHDELAALVNAGLTPYQALEAATRVPMTWMGVADDRGTIEIGKRADLLLLDGDPLADIANTRKIAGVALSGRWLPRTELDAKLHALAQRYATEQP